MVTGSTPTTERPPGTRRPAAPASRPASVTTGGDRLPGAAGSVSPAGRPRQVAGTTVPTARAPWVFSRCQAGRRSRRPWPTAADRPSVPGRRGAGRARATFCQLSRMRSTGSTFRRPQYAGNLTEGKEPFGDTVGRRLKERFVPVRMFGYVSGSGSPWGCCGRGRLLCLVRHVTTCRGSFRRFRSCLIPRHAGLGIDAEALRRDPTWQGFKVIPRRRLVERPFGWLMHHRRLARDYETHPHRSAAMINLAMVDLTSRRLTRESTLNWRDTRSTNQPLPEQGALSGRGAAGHTAAQQAARAGDERGQAQFGEDAVRRGGGRREHRQACRVLHGLERRQ